MKTFNTNNTLTFRQETKYLFLQPQEHLGISRRSWVSRLMELGTGNGIIPTVLAISNSNLRTWGVDKTENHVKTAKLNAKAILVPNHRKNTRFSISHWAKVTTNLIFGTVLSNPPYLALGNYIGTLINRRSITLEDTEALVYRENCYDNITITAKRSLGNHGVLLLEHSHNHSNIIRQKLNYYYFRNIVTIRDLSKLSRFVTGTPTLTN